MRFRLTLDFDVTDVEEANQVKNWLETSTVKIVGRTVAGPHPTKYSPITVYTDGGCDNKKGIGAWAVVMEHPEKGMLEYAGSATNTTNNLMEMHAVFKALELLDPDQSAIIVCDSEYVIKGCTDWLKNWKKNGWKTYTGKPVKNQEHWELIDLLLASHPKVVFQHTHGHIGVAGNERCDVLCTQTMKELEAHAS